MNRISILVLLAVCVVCGNAVAQSAGSPTAERAAITDSRPQARAELKRTARSSGKIGATGPAGKTAEAGAIGTDRAAAAGDVRAKTREARRASKNGDRKARAALGSTPK